MEPQVDVVDMDLDVYMSKKYLVYRHVTPTRVVPHVVDLLATY